MKTLTFLFFILSFATANAKTVPSSCDAPDSVKDKFKLDAERLAWRRMVEIGSSYADSEKVPMVWIDSAMRPLLAVYNSGLSAVDTIHSQIPLVIDNYFDTIKIKVSNEKKIGLTIITDTSYEWVKNLNLWVHGERDSLHPTGDVPIDSLINRFGLTYYSHYSSGSSFGLEVQFTSRDVNAIFAIEEAFSKLDGVYKAYTYYSIIGDLSSEIYQFSSDSSVSLLYYYAWGDCLSGCMYKHFWQFTVFPDCSVRLDSSHGSSFQLLDVHQERINSPVLYPNPATNKLTLEATERCVAVISDVNGKELTSYNLTEGKNELVIANLPSGYYFVTIRDRSGSVSTARFIKE